MTKLGGVAENDINERLSASLASFQPKIADNIKIRTDLTEIFMDKKLREVHEGGLEVAIHFRYKRGPKLSETGGAGLYQYYQQLNTTSTSTIKTGKEPYAQMNIPISLSNQESRENAGKKKFNRLKEKTAEAMDDAAEQIQNIIMGVSGVADAPSSLFDIVSGADAGTIHGLSKASNAWLNSQYKASIGDAGQYLLKNFANGYNSCRNNSPSKVDKID